MNAFNFNGMEFEFLCAPSDNTWNICTNCIFDSHRATTKEKYKEKRKKKTLVAEEKKENKIIKYFVCAFLTNLIIKRKFLFNFEIYAKSFEQKMARNIVKTSNNGDTQRNGKDKRFSIHDAFEEETDEAIRVYGSTVISTPARAKTRSTEDVTIRVHDPK